VMSPPPRPHTVEPGALPSRVPIPLGRRRPGTSLEMHGAQQARALAQALSLNVPKLERLSTPSPERSRSPSRSRSPQRGTFRKLPSSQFDSNRQARTASPPPRPHTVEPGALPSRAARTPIPEQRSGTSLAMHGAQQARSLAQAVNLMTRPPSSARGMQSSAPRPPAIEDPKLPEIPALNWLPASDATTRAAGSQAAATRSTTQRQGSSASAPKTGVLGRGFVEQIHKGLALSSSIHLHDAASSGPSGVKGPWPHRAGPLSRAAASRPRS